MENVASTEAGTMKKKRNRSHKKPKAAEHPEPTEHARQHPIVEKENNPPARETANDHQPAAVELSDASELTRKPSRRRKRKPKANKDETSNVEVQPITVAELFPPGQICTQTVPQAPKSDLPAKPVVKKSDPKQPVDVKKCVGITDIRPEELFPTVKGSQSAIQNVTLDEIFPGPDLFRFDAGGIIPGKLNFGVPNKRDSIVAEPKQVAKRALEYAQQGLQDISVEDLFPTSLSVGVKTVAKKAQVSNPTSEQPGTMSSSAGSAPERSREEILAEREAKKAAKLAAKSKSKDKATPAQATSVPAQKAKDQRPATAKAPSKNEPGKQAPVELQKSSTDASICEKMKDLHISEGPATEKAPPAQQALSKAERKAQFEAKNPSLVATAAAGSDGTKVTAKPTLTKAERRAIQEAQRAAKAEAQQVKKPSTTTEGQKETKKSVHKTNVQEIKPTKAPAAVKKIAPTGGTARTKHIVNLFNHLHQPKFAATEIVNSPTLHPAVTRLGIQYAEGAVVGSKARCLALLKVLNQLIHEYETPPEKEFARSFEETLNVSASHLQRCRPFSVSMTNALRHVKMYARQLDGKVSVSEQKECLLEAIESYIRDQIEKAEEAICSTVQDKIYDGDVILTYGCSSLIKHILEEANRRKKNFRVIIVNARPRQEENAMLEQLVQQGVKCMCVLINAVSYVMPEVTKVLLGAHALLANGSVMSRVGTAQIALVAKSYNVPVLVCCETHKFTERVQTDAFVYNELGNPNELVLAPRTRDLAETKPMLADWETITSLTILNLHYDVTPPELVTAVVTEVAILPCTSVPVILRIKPSDVAY
uniref:Translation initiation factor eIF2B subunit delta n=1 Tax=Anopheles dirus TaxID=7168 RepID=A0A182NIP3_9DIPT